MRAYLVSRIQTAVALLTVDLEQNLRNNVVALATDTEPKDDAPFHRRPTVIHLPFQ